MAKTEPLSADPLRAATDIATVIYTSGTTGSPKGAIHRFTSFVYFERAVAQVIGSGSDHRVLSYLPLAHIAERALTETPALCRGWHIFFCENVATFLTDLKRARPTIFFSVPRLFMKFQQGVFEKLQKRILDRALGIPLLGPKLAKRILHQLGLDTVCLAACGSAALPLDVLLWFRGLGLPLIEGYGATETGITHVPPNGESRPGYVGKGVPGVETKLGENAEILIRSPMNMVGYLKDSAQTMEMITADGFIRTGDIGELSPDGWLRICGRLKDQFKTSKGEYVSPVRIEMLLTHSGVVETSLVMGSGLPAPFAVVVLSEKAAAEPRNVIEIALHDILQSVNSMLSSHERVKFLVVEPAAWTIANGYVTPTHKLKRSALELHYKPLIDSWVRQDTQIVWQELE